MRVRAHVHAWPWGTAATAAEGYMSKEGWVADEVRAARPYFVGLQLMPAAV